MSEALSGARNRLLCFLAETIDGARQTSDITRLMEESPIEESLLLARTTISELLTTFVACNRTPDRSLLEILTQSVQQMPQNPIAVSAAKRSDHAAALLLNTIGVKHPSLQYLEILPLQPPAGWLDLSLWAADQVAFAVPSLQSPAQEIVSRSQLELARGAVFAAIRECTSVAIRILRWLPWCDLRSPSGSALQRLFFELRKKSQQKNIRSFHLSVISAFLRSSN